MIDLNNMLSDNQEIEVRCIGRVWMATLSVEVEDNTLSYNGMAETPEAAIENAFQEGRADIDGRDDC